METQQIPKPRHTIKRTTILLDKLERKCEDEDVEFVKVPRNFPSTQICSKCKKRNKKISGIGNLKIREWDCPHCPAHHNRDLNAAKNILDKGLENRRNDGAVKFLKNNIFLGVCESPSSNDGEVQYKGFGGFALVPVDLFDLVVVMESVGVFITFKYANVAMISDKIKPIKEQTLGKVIVTFSSCSFGIYFSHYIIMLYLQRFGFMRWWGYKNVFVYFPLEAIIIIGICWALIYTMSKIPLLKIGSGVK